jgi:hypothetical protein
MHAGLLFIPKWNILNFMPFFVRYFFETRHPGEVRPQSLDYLIRHYEGAEEGLREEATPVISPNVF